MFLLLISLNGLLRSLHSLAKTVRGMESSLLYYCEILRNLYFCVESALFRHCEKIRKDFRGNPFCKFLSRWNLWNRWNL